MSNTTSFKRLTLEDLPVMMAIEREAFTMAWSSSVMRDSLMAAHCRAWGLYAQNRLVGFGILSLVLDEAEILSMSIDPIYHRRGYGEALLQFLISQALKGKADAMHLEVQHTNLAALNLYHKNGFKPVGTRKAYYPTPNPSVREDAILLSLSLSAQASKNIKKTSETGRSLKPTLTYSETRA